MGRTRSTVVFFSPSGAAVPEVVDAWAAASGFVMATHADPQEVASLLLRGRPALVVFDGTDDAAGTGLGLLARLKDDAYTAIVPAAALLASHDADAVQRWFKAGADDVVPRSFPRAEQLARLDAVLHRAERDVAVHPSTRLPGTTDIEREIRRRIGGDEPFAVCYADLDHFKEFNDRYSYYDGDRVIFLLSRILHDVVKGMLGSRGFVGHIGGDDFIFILPATEISPVCQEILSVFDTLIPMQYTEPDRRAGYFFGKDRRGQLHRVPLMTLSIGIVTNRERQFNHPAEVSELATEMKGYAKTLPGSKYVVDRRRGNGPEGGAARPPEGERKPS